MSGRTHQSAQRVGIMFRRKKIWISELLSLFFVYAILILFFSLSVFILINHAVIDRNSRKCASLRAQKVEMIQLIEQLVAQEKITAAMKSVVRNTLSDTVFYQLVDLVYRNSKTYGYDPLLVLAVIQVESFFEPNALGRYKNMRLSGALGLMQVKPGTAREVAGNLGMPMPRDEDLFNPDVNIVVGIAYLTKCIGTFKSFKLGLLAYNQGPGVIKGRLQENQPLSIDYYERVLKKYFALKKAIEPLL
jgi:soluble lytic murein transglycosylase-like protein